MCVWSTGLAANPLTRRMQTKLSGSHQNPKRRAISVDAHLRIRGVADAESAFAIGDCADVKAKASEGAELLDRAEELFTLADADKSGTVDREELVAILDSLAHQYPQVKALTAGGSDSRLQDIMEKFDDDKSGELDRREFAKAMAEADARLSSHPATAQVANQQGAYVARTLNALAREKKKISTTSGDGAASEPPGGVSAMRPFEYNAPREFRDARIGAGRDGASRGLHQHGVRHDGALGARTSQTACRGGTSSSSPGTG